MLFDNKTKGGKGEKLEFEVHTRMGKSKEVRKENHVFAVVKEEHGNGERGDIGSSHVSALEAPAVEGA